MYKANITQVEGLSNFSYDDKLPLKLGLILLATAIVFLFCCLLFLICRRLRKYKRLTDRDNYYDGYESEDSEITQFDKEKIRLTGFIDRHAEPAIQATRIHAEHATHHEQGLQSAFSIGDETEGDSDVEDSRSTSKSHGLCATVDPITIMTNVTAVAQQIPESTTGFREPITFSTVFGPEEGQTQNEKCACEDTTPTPPVPLRCTVRRVSSTPNLQSHPGESTKGSVQPASTEAQDKGQTDASLDDAELFTKGYTEEEMQLANVDGTLVNSTERDLERSNGSIGDIGSTRPLLPLQLPSWALETDKPERGFLVFALSINPKPGCTGVPRFLIDVRVLEARCVLSHSVEPRAGRFYVKARIQPAGSNSTSESVLSLDQLNSRPRGFISERVHAFTLTRAAASVSCGSTPVRRAFRSPVFWHAITLETGLPGNYSEAKPSLRFGAPLSSNLTNISPANQLELRLDLKERDALKADGLYGSGSTMFLPHWRRSQLLGSVRIPLSQKIWDYFLGDDRKLRNSSLGRSNLIPESKGNTDESDRESTNGSDGANEVIRVLRFVRPISPPPDETADRGDLTVGIQYSLETGKLTLNPLKCTGICLPKGTRCVLLSAALVSNRKLISIQKSNPSARLTTNAAEFLLGERMQFLVEEHLSQVCLILSVFARSGRRINDTITLIGRCVVGPEGLAYGQGLSHWNAINNQRGIVKRTHVLF
ncbi:hypothetical protein EG68_05318 [Paragonimus skrjabini miyazakii]|uniref:Uncharacterized protein n=1 Tax=Paragonimus skrjabini miyazakii TaxID=59628 RepID=A0A8S9YWH8_9TREM|nr:hypothetical protein EG68_05318 [Paragonimus skrjabini miyazakii]